MSHFACMIDLETMGLGMNCALISMSAQIADLENKQGFAVEAEYNCYFNLEGQTNRIFDPSTILWWMQQGDAARQELLNEKRIPLHWGLKDFWTWYIVQAPKEIHAPIQSIWSKGVDFDVAILDAYYKGGNQYPPWGYRDRMCYRTLAACYPQIPFIEPEVKHSARGDCRQQLEHLYSLWKLVKIGTWGIPDATPSS
jgi:hypothetical protein